MVRLIIDPQLFSVVFHIEDTQGQAWEIRVDEDWSKSGSGDTVFNESFWSGTHTAILRGIAFPAQTVVFTVKAIDIVAPPATTLPPPPVFPPKPGEPLPVSSGETHQTYVGTRCEVVGMGSFGQFWYRWRDKYTDQGSNWRRDYSEALDAANRNTACFLPAPPTAKDWQDGIQKQVTAGFDALSNYFSNGLKSVTESWQKGIFDLETRMKDWIEKQILEILWRAMNRDTAVK